MDYKAKYETLSRMLIREKFEQKFYNHGGNRPPEGWTPGEPTPADLLKAHLGDRLMLAEDGTNLLVSNPDGSTTTIEAKLQELRSNDFGVFFDPGFRSQPPGTVSAEDARLGKASIDAIASGESQVI